jgi:hypothetical protein
MAINPKKGLLNWPAYTDNDLTFFLTNADTTITETRNLISELRELITSFERRTEHARCREEREKWVQAIGATRVEIEHLTDQARRLEGNKRAAGREVQVRKGVGVIGEMGGNGTTAGKVLEEK